MNRTPWRFGAAPGTGSEWRAGGGLTKPWNRANTSVGVLYNGRQIKLEDVPEDHPAYPELVEEQKRQDRKLREDAKRQYEEHQAYLNSNQFKQDREAWAKAEMKTETEKADDADQDGDEDDEGDGEEDEEGEEEDEEGEEDDEEEAEEKGAFVSAAAFAGEDGKGAIVAMSAEDEMRAIASYFFNPQANALLNDADNWMLGRLVEKIQSKIDRNGVRALSDEQMQNAIDADTDNKILSQEESEQYHRIRRAMKRASGPWHPAIYQNFR